MKKSPWDLSQMSGKDIEDLKRIFRHRRSRLVLTDGLDDGNAQLNGIRRGLYQDMSQPEHREPEIPEEYREPTAHTIIKRILLCAGVLWCVIIGAQFLKEGYENVVVVFTLCLGALALGMMARR